jgi:hypothetical protein
MVMVMVMVMVMMVTVTAVPAMVMMMVVMMVLRQLHVRVSPSLGLVARRVHRIGGDQQSDCIRDRLKQLCVRPGGQNVGELFCPRRFHRAYSYKSGNCTHEASGLLIHVHLRERTMLMRNNYASRQLAP